MGFAWFGAVIGGFVALVLLARHYHMKILLMLDIASPAAAIGYGVGRIGCLISGDGDYGTPTSLPWGMSFPNGLVPTTDRVHPTPIYEFLAAHVDWLYLVAYWSARRRRIAARRRGLRFLLDSYRRGAFPGGIHSHQSAFIFWFDERANGERRFDCSRAYSCYLALAAKNSPANGHLGLRII